MRTRLVVPALSVLGACVVVATLDDPVASYPWLMGAVIVATIGWLAATFLVGRSGAGSAAANNDSGAGDLLVVVLVAVAARVLLLVPTVPLSDDLYRYLWDGRVGNAGINPFRHAPSSVELSELRDEKIWPNVNHTDIPTIYPPAAQVMFAVLDRVAPSVLGARAAAALFDLLTFGLLVTILRRRGHPPALALLHGWCPLAILESAGGGHVDAWGVCLLMAGLVALERGTDPTDGVGGIPKRGPSRFDALGGLLTGLSALVKPMGVFLVPGLLRARRPARGAMFLAGGVISLLLVLPYADVGERLFTGFLAYAERWQFNDCFYTLLVEGGATPRGARLFLGAVLVLVSVALPLRVCDPLASAGAVFGAFLLLSPTVHPWYALWLVPLLPFLPRPIRPAGLALVALLPVSYAAAWIGRGGQEWAEPRWSRLVLWGPVLGLLVAGLVRAWASRRGTRRSRINAPARRASPPRRSSRGS